MAADLSLLVPEFQNKVEQLLENCLQKGVEMRPYEGLRSPFVQAKYWRRSRTKEQIDQKINELKSAGANYLAYCLESVGPQQGKLATGVIPGYSWHQWGEAVDCFWVVNGEAVWDLKTLVRGVNGYKVYADEAKKIGLEAGLFWQDFVDAPHVQMRRLANPGKIYSVNEINDAMKEEVFVS
jgi:peptidoglycan LD-endopeptidase CwlK